MPDAPAPRPPDTSSGALLKLAWPLFVANLAVVGNGTIDAMMAGRLSATDLAAVAVGSSVYVTVYIGFMGVLQALSPIAGHHYGARRWRAIGDDVQQALWLSLLLTVAGLPWVLATDLWVGFAQVDGSVGRIARALPAGDRLRPACRARDTCLRRAQRGGFAAKGHHGRQPHGTRR